MISKTTPKILFVAILTLSFSIVTASIPSKWWTQYNASIRFYPGLQKITFNQIKDQLPEWNDMGYKVIEIYQPYQMLTDKKNNIKGAVDFSITDKSLGTLADFQQLVKTAHRYDIAVVVTLDLGCFARESQAFQKACADMASNTASEERKWFVWDKDGKDNLSYDSLYNSPGKWLWNDTAKSYFYANSKGNPLVNYGTEMWPRKAEKILTFWLTQKIDGLIIQNVCGYANMNPRVQYAIFARLSNKYPNVMIQPEGQGVEKVSPLYWIKEVGYNSIQDYRMQEWWEKKSVILDAIKKQDPRQLNEIISASRDSIVAAHGVALLYPQWEQEKIGQSERLLEIFTIVTSGYVFCLHDGRPDLIGQSIIAKWPVNSQNRIADLLMNIVDDASMSPISTRKYLKTDNPKAFAQLRISSDNKLVTIPVSNFSKKSIQLKIDLSGMKLTPKTLITDVFTYREFIPDATKKIKITLPAYGFALLQVK